MRIIVFALPWRNLLVPAHQPAALAPWLRQHGCDTDVRHLYLDIAQAFEVARYQDWDKRFTHEDHAQEATYSGLLWPDRRQRLSEFLTWAGLPGWGPEVWRDWQAAHDQAFDSVDWAAYDLAIHLGAGVISSPESHFLAGLYAAKAIKDRSPATRTVLAGPDVIGEIGRSVVVACDWVDVVVNGEPEPALLGLAQAIQAGEPPRVPGLLYRQPDGSVPYSRAEQLPDLDVLPTPDYDAYWGHPALAGLLPPVLRLETARGCWYDRSYVDPRHSCQFCNINVDWIGYRTKSIPRVLAELRHLADRHGATRFSFTDKVHRPKDMQALYEAIGAEGRGWEFYANEGHISMPAATLETMARAGVRSIQFGVEGLVPSVLQRMNKGVGFAKIVEILRTCTELDLPVIGNLIVDYPGTVQAEVDETLRRLTLLEGMIPLHFSVLNIGYGSPLTLPATALPGVANSPVYEALLPADLAGRLELMHKVTDRSEERADWSPVVRYLQAWQAGYARRPYAGRKEWQRLDDGSALVAIWDGQGEVRTGRLGAPLGDLLETCRPGPRWEAIAASQPEVTEETLRALLAGLVAAGLLAHEDDRWITLALRSRMPAAGR